MASCGMVKLCTTISPMIQPEPAWKCSTRREAGISRPPEATQSIAVIRQLRDVNGDGFFFFSRQRMRRARPET